VAIIFIGCGIMIFAAGGTAPANEIMQLLILAGVVFNFLDGQARTRQTSQQIAENTAITTKTEQSVNGHAEERIRAASQAAYAKGVLDGQTQERERASKSYAPQPSVNGKKQPHDFPP